MSCAPVLLRGATRLRVVFGSRDEQPSRRLAGVRAERFSTRGGVRQAAGHKPRCAAPRLRRGLGGPHGAGLDVRRCQRLQPSDVAGGVLAADRLHGVDQVDRATLDVRDAWSAGGVEVNVDATVAKGT